MKINYRINKNFINFITNLKQMNKKRALVNLYKDIVLVTRVRIFCKALFTNNNIKVVIQIDAFLAHQNSADDPLKLMVFALN